MNKLFNDSDFNIVSRKHKISIFFLFLIPSLIILTLVLCFVFINRDNQSYLFFVMSAITVIMTVALVFSIMFFKFTDSFFRLFKRIKKNELETVCSNVECIENELVTLEKYIQVKQIYIIINNEPFIAYFLSNYDLKIRENKSYKFVLSGNFIVEYEEYEN